jgi:hypothetical protein
LAGVIGTAALALWKGGAAERLGVIVYFSVSLFHMLIRTDPASLMYSYETLLADLVIAAGFLVLALRYSSLWLAGAMVAQGLATAIHGFHLEDEQINQKMIWMGVNVWIVANNVISSVVFWMLLGGTIATWRKRNQLKRAARSAAKLVADALSAPGRTAAAA